MATTTKPTRKPAVQPALPLDGEPEQMQRFHPESRANRIADLGIGESLAEAKRLDFDNTTKAEVDEVIQNLKSTMSKVAVRAAQRSGHTFTTEIGQFITRSGDIIVTAVVTRTA